jgi:hypothetical protein
MAPLGVRVVTVILGGVETTGNNPDNRKDLVLPGNSYYQKIAAIINHHQKGFIYTNKQNLDVAARNVVNDILCDRSGFIRRGQASTLSWILNTFLPYALTIYFANGESGLGELGRK